MLYALPRTPSPSFTVRDAPRAGDGFPDDLREFIALRLDRVDPYRESVEYRCQQEKASRLYARLLEMLPEEGRAVLMEYGEAVGDAHYLEVMILADRAFLEG